MVLLLDFMSFLSFFPSSTTWNTYTMDHYLQKENGGRVGCEGAWKI
jgi:hypothetical protein